MADASPSPAFPDPDRRDRQLAVKYGRVMRTQARESWLVPLLAVPLTGIALSPTLEDEDLVRFGGKQIEGRGRDLARRARSVIDSVVLEKHSLTDEEGVLLIEASHDLVQLGAAFLYPPGFLLAGAGIDAELTGEPLRRETAKWIAEGPQSPACSAFVVAHTLSMGDDPMGWLPRAAARYAPVTAPSTGGCTTPGSPRGKRPSGWHTGIG